VSKPLGMLEQEHGYFMIAGDRCTRTAICAVTTPTLPLESDEPARVAEATRASGLRHIVLTAVARDDLSRRRAEHFRQTKVRRCGPSARALLLRCSP